MSSFKFTGTNIAAALLIIAFFFPWFSAMGTLSMSGFSITTNGISPGMLGMFLKGFDRLLMILLIIIPVCGAIILYQNISGNQQFKQYFGPAHGVPAVLLLLGIVLIYFKMKPDTADFDGEDLGDLQSLRHLSRAARDLAPGVFDVLGIGVYTSLAAAVYLLLVKIGIVKDREYYKSAAAAATVNPAEESISKTDTK